MPEYTMQATFIAEKRHCRFCQFVYDGDIDTFCSLFKNAKGSPIKLREDTHTIAEVFRCAACLKEAKPVENDNRPATSEESCAFAESLDRVNKLILAWPDWKQKALGIGKHLHCGKPVGTCERCGKGEY